MVRIPDPNDRKRRLRAPRRVDTSVPLRLRYREVTALVGSGMSYRETALSLIHRRDDHSISPHTVRQYAKEIKRLVGSDRTPRDTLVALFEARKADFGPLADSLRGGKLAPAEDGG